MNRFKKILISVVSVFALGSSIMAMPISADYDGTTENDVTFVSKDIETFGTVYEKNALTVINAEYYEDSTVFQFFDGTEYTLPMCDDLILSPLITPYEPEAYRVDENGDLDYREECYYIIGYGVNYKQPNSYYKSQVQDSTYASPKEVTLPDGEVVDVQGYGNIQAVYNLDGKYMGYRTIVGESYYSEIVAPKSTTIGDSTVTGLRGDVNLDGEVNGLDLLMLKKYIIGLISW